MRNRIENLMRDALRSNEFPEEQKATFRAWIEAKSDADASKAASANVMAAIAGSDHRIAQEIRSLEKYLVKKSIWVFGGDGWAYDIGFGGLDHVLASGQDINVLVLDTEVYSNTGGQSSKSTPIAAVAKFAAAGKGCARKTWA